MTATRSVLEKQTRSCGTFIIGGKGPGLAAVVEADDPAGFGAQINDRSGGGEKSLIFMGFFRTLLDVIVLFKEA